MLCMQWTFAAEQPEHDYVAVPCHFDSPLMLRDTPHRLPKSETGPDSLPSEFGSYSEYSV